MAKVPGFAKAFAGCWCIAEMDKRGVLRERHNENDPACGRGSGFGCARG